MMLCVDDEDDDLATGVEGVIVKFAVLRANDVGFVRFAGGEVGSVLSLAREGVGVSSTCVLDRFLDFEEEAEVEESRLEAIVVQ